MNLITFHFFLSHSSNVITKWYNEYNSDSSNDFNYWDFARTFIALIWDGHSWLWHGYEVVGLENLPTNGPALIIYYHGAIPIDMYYFVARVYLKRNRLIYTVGDRFLFKMPGKS